jgi:hypothetical protein
VASTFTQGMDFGILASLVRSESRKTLKQRPQPACPISIPIISGSQFALVRVRCSVLKTVRLMTEYLARDLMVTWVEVVGRWLRCKSCCGGEIGT